jgi:hypothetical protein
VPCTSRCGSSTHDGRLSPSSLLNFDPEAPVAAAECSARAACCPTRSRGPRAARSRRTYTRPPAASAARRRLILPLAFHAVIVKPPAAAGDVDSRSSPRGRPRTQPFPSLAAHPAPSAALLKPASDHTGTTRPTTPTAPRFAPVGAEWERRGPGWRWRAFSCRVVGSGAPTRLMLDRTAICLMSVSDPRSNSREAK